MSISVADRSWIRASPLLNMILVGEWSSAKYHCTSGVFYSESYLGKVQSWKC